MARRPYTCLYRHIWDDEEFYTMSELGQNVFFFVISAPDGHGLGCFKSGLNGMAEYKRMDSERFREGFEEVMGRGFVDYDPKHMVVFIPTYFENNLPSNPNGITALGKEFLKVPDCELKLKCFHIVKDWCDMKGGGFLEKFKEWFEEPRLNHSKKDIQNQSLNESLNGSGNGSNNQSENNQVNDPPSPSSSPSSSPANTERTLTRTKQDEETELRRQYIPPSSGYDRSNLTPLNRKLGDILFTYFPHVGDFQCDEWALRLNSEYGKKLNLEKLFKEIGESDRGNIKKVRAGMEYRHIRSWCRNADGSKEFALDTGNGMTGGIDIFMSKDGRRRFTGLFKQSGKSLRECIDAAGEDGSAPREMIEQWEEDLKEYEEELNGQ